MVNLARAGDIILFHHPHPQSHCAPLEKKPKALSLIETAIMDLGRPLSRHGVGWDPSLQGLAVPLVIFQPQTPRVCWGIKVAPTTAQNTTHPAADDDG